MWSPPVAAVNESATTTGDALAAVTGVGAKQPLYLFINNTSNAAVTLVRAGATSATTGLTLAATEVAMAGPILAEDIPKWGLYAGATKVVSIQYVSAKTNLDTRTPVSVGYEGSRDVPFVPFTWTKLVSV